MPISLPLARGQGENLVPEVHRPYDAEAIRTSSLPKGVWTPLTAGQPVGTARSNSAHSRCSSVHKVRKVLAHHSRSAQEDSSSTSGGEGDAPRALRTLAQYRFEVGTHCSSPGTDGSSSAPQHHREPHARIVGQPLPTGGRHDRRAHALPRLVRFPQVGWGEIYRDWESDDLKYYWPPQLSQDQDEHQLP